MTIIQKAFNLNKYWTDWAKLVAAILVAVSHYSTCVCITNHWSDSAFLRLWCQGGNLGVALFFFLSGYGLMESERKKHLGLKLFIKRRFAKVYLPVVLVSVVWIPVCYFFTTHYHPGSIWDVVYDVFWGFKDSVLWFVYILFALYGLFFIYSQVRPGRTVLSTVLMLSGTVLIMLGAWKLGYPFINVPIFALGVWASELQEVKILKLPVVYWMLLMLGIVYTMAFLIDGDVHAIHGVINCVFIVILLIIIRLSPPPHHVGYRQSVLTFVVPATYMLYLTHHKVLSFIVWNRGQVSFLEWATVTIIITVLFTLLQKLLKL